MISFPNAKINIGLYITQKRTDGYHQIETVLYPIPFQDILEIRTNSAKKTRFQNLGIAIDNIEPEQTSVLKAYRLLQKDFALPPIDCILYKNIPFGAGLGGGSADAAFMLKLLNDYFTLQLSVEDLEEYATQLGSDDSFFVKNIPQLASGRGENVQPLNLSLKGLHLLLLKPDIHISTAIAYQSITPFAANFDLKKLPELPLKEWQNKISNHFEKGVCNRYPLLQQLKVALYDSGAIYASLSGSGSALYGIFQTKPQLPEKIAQNILWQGVL